LRSADEIERVLKTCYPKWEDKPFLEIRRAAVNELLDEVQDAVAAKNNGRDGKATAQMMLRILSGLFAWYQTRDENYTSPIVRGMARNDAKPRTRTLTDDEIRALWKAAGEAGTFGRYLKFTLLTAQRRMKIARLRWDDIDADGVWTVRTAPREKVNIGKVKLPKFTRDILEEQPRVDGNPYVFPGTGVGPINGFSALKAKLPKDMTPWSIHDLRRTARTLLTEKRCGVDRDTRGARARPCRRHACRAHLRPQPIPGPEIPRTLSAVPSD
jgi:integrase